VALRVLAGLAAAATVSTVTAARHEASTALQADRRPARQGLPTTIKAAFDRLLAGGRDSPPDPAWMLGIQRGEGFEPSRGEHPTGCRDIPGGEHLQVFSAEFGSNPTREQASSSASAIDRLVPRLALDQQLSRAASAFELVGEACPGGRVEI
jgi:hypothetical protein